MRFSTHILSNMLIPESCEHPASMYRLQLPVAQHNLAIGLSLLRDLLLVTPESVSFLVSLDQALPFDFVKELISKLQNSSKRVFLVKGSVSSLFAQDFGKTLTTSPGTIKILVPFGSGQNKISVTGGDSDLQQTLEIVESQLYWDGGNILCDSNYCLIGAKSIAINMHRKSLDREQVIETFEREFGHPVVILGNVEEAHSNPYDSCAGQADFHIDLDVSILGKIDSNRKPIALLAGTSFPHELAERLVANTDLLEDHFLPKTQIADVFYRDLEVSIAKRQPYIDAYRSSLAKAGYECMEMVDMRLLQNRNFMGKKNFSFNYVNGLPFMDDSRNPFFYTFDYGIDLMDSAAKSVFNSLGVKMASITKQYDKSANDFLFLRGGLHCTVSKVF